MLRGELYDPLDAELVRERLTARLLVQKLNALPEDETELRAQTLKRLMPFQGEGLWLQPPFYCDYGYNIKTGNKVFFNFNCVVLDVMQVTIGNNTLFGPAVQIYTATHPINWQERASGLEYAKPVTIGSDVWVGGGAIICPGITIGDRTVIGAGSVVTKDIPSDVFAAGNPCGVIRQIN
ncbi:MAG TPA: sugar O-acetyltransferase [Bacteroidia bacterium]|nr:sugar O-acetyltransferase [Bacteroidia bacterium]